MLPVDCTTELSTGLMGRAMHVFVCGAAGGAVVD